MAVNSIGAHCLWSYALSFWFGTSQLPIRYYRKYSYSSIHKYSSMSLDRVNWQLTAWGRHTLLRSPWLFRCICIALESWPIWRLHKLELCVYVLPAQCISRRSHGCNCRQWCESILRYLGSVTRDFDPLPSGSDGAAQYIPLCLKMRYPLNIQNYGHTESERKLFWFVFLGTF